MFQHRLYCSCSDKKKVKRTKNNPDRARSCLRSLTKLYLQGIGIRIPCVSYSCLIQMYIVMCKLSVGSHCRTWVNYHQIILWSYYSSKLKDHFQSCQICVNMYIWTSGSLLMIIVKILMPEQAESEWANIPQPNVLKRPWFGKAFFNEAFREMFFMLP